jgi:glycosyltransferase involved in cell wall biosynthesis
MEKTKMSISVIIPSYRNPKYLDLCITALLENQVEKNEIIVVIDGFVKESQDVIDKYKNIVYFILFEDNQELPAALNTGVYNASNERILILNEDNVVGKGWDNYLGALSKFGSKDKPVVYTVNQVEPIQSIYNFTIGDYGRDLETFDYQRWLKEEQQLRLVKETEAGNTWPAFFEKRLYMMVNGFDPLYGSGYVADWDFFLKLEMIGCEMRRTYATNIYHFISKSIKRIGIDYPANEKETFAREIFRYKWGFNPVCQNRTHSHMPISDVINGVKFK